MVNNHKTKKWKIQLNMYINFISSKDTGETRTTYVWSDNEEIRWGNEIINKLFKCLLKVIKKKSK